MTERQSTISLLRELDRLGDLLRQVLNADHPPRHDLTSDDGLVSRPCICPLHRMAREAVGEEA